MSQLQQFPLLPESAPFSQGQRAWLNGFFGGILSRAVAPPATAVAPVVCNSVRRSSVMDLSST